MTKKKTNAAALLPLKPQWFHLLLALGEGPAHGFEIRSRVEARTDGKLTLWPAMLYGTIRRMTASGLIESLDGEAGPDADARRRYYRLTPFGRQVLLAEAERLALLVRHARVAARAGHA